MNSQHYDLITIGGGSGGLAVAIKAADMGRKVAIIEANRIGGTCVNNGCVPKKVMWYAANLAHAVDDAAHRMLANAKMKVPAGVRAGPDGTIFLQLGVVARS